jgi:hypothetical protein
MKHNLESKKEFVSYELALALKELGFDEPCIAFYLEKVLTFHTHGIDPHFIFKKNSNLWYSSSAPTYSQAFRFFREKFNLFSCVELHLNFPIRYYFIIDEIGNDDFVYHTEDETIFYDKYEDAEIACLKLLIELVKNKSI